MSAVPSRRAEPTRTAFRVALCSSLVLHGLGIITARSALRLPELDLELALPSEAEFGVMEPTGERPAQEQPPNTPPPAPPEAAAAQAPQPTTAATAAPQVHKPRPAAPAPPKPKPPLPASLAGAGDAANYAPKGTQLALRLDLDRLRHSPLGEDAAGLLSALPDVRALLEGSGVDAARDLTRLFLASPDLRREHVVMAGRYVGDDSVPKLAVERLAQRKGVVAQWQQRRGIPTAPWHNSDETERVVALIGPSVFAITRPDDLPRVLAVARASRSRAGTRDTSSDDLVQMEERELLNAAAENARSFVRGARAQLAPERIALSIRESDQPILDLHATAHYPDATQAQAAQQYWDNLRARYAAHPLVALMNLDRVLNDLEITRRDAELTARVKLPHQQARLLMRFVRDSLRGPEPTAPAR